MLTAIIAILQIISNRRRCVDQHVPNPMTYALPVRFKYTSNRSCNAGRDDAAVSLRFCRDSGPSRWPQRRYHAATIVKTLKTMFNLRL